MNPAALYNAAVDVLNAAVAVLDASSALRAPDRRYVSVGDPALDCDQITVAASARPALVASSGAGFDAARHHRRARVLVAEFRIHVVRCGYPTLDQHGNPPRDADLGAWQRGRLGFHRFGGVGVWRRAKRAPTPP